MQENRPFIRHNNKSMARYSGMQKLCILSIILISILLLCFAGLCIGLLVRFLVKTHSNDNAMTSPISLDDLSNSSFSVNYFYGEWSGPEDQIFTLTEKGLETIFPSNNTSILLVDISIWIQMSIDRWTLSPTNSYILLAHSVTKLFRHSYTADYTLFNLDTLHNYGIVGSQWRVVEWAGTGDSLVLANQTGLYYIQDVSSSLVGNISPLRAAADGELVGYPDWVYEEEILSSNSAVWASKSIEPTLAYLTFNSSEVLEATIIKYGNEIGPYPSYQKIPYPKAGDRESIVKLYLVNASDGGTCQINIPAEYHYVQSVEWVNSTQLSLRLLNYAQTNISLNLYSTSCALIQTVHTHQTAGWIESNLLSSIFLSTGEILTLLPMNDKIQIVKIKDNTLTQLTHANEVGSLLSVYNSDKIFYTSGNYSYQTILYYISLSDPSEVNCVNCDVEEKRRRECKVASAAFSQSGDYFILTCLGPDIPFSLLINSNTLRIVRVLEENSVLSQTLASISLPSIHPFQFTNESEIFFGTRMVPAGFTESNPFPVLLYVYGGPNSNLASLFHPLIPFSGYIAHLVSSLGFVVITVEGRGTCCRGQAFRFQVKDKLGVFEAEDQIDLSRYLLSQRWVSSVSIMGSSYGGYLSGLTLASGSDVLAAGVVISPVTDWRYYDSIYTQRYMGTPQDNAKGYNDSSLLLRADTIDGRKLLLIHGSADDNVHYQNSAELSLTLKRNGQQFRMHTYFNENHHLRQQGTRKHLYELLDLFLKEKVLN